VIVRALQAPQNQDVQRSLQELNALPLTVYRRHTIHTYERAGNRLATISTPAIPQTRITL